MQSVIFDTNVLLDLFVFNDFRAIHLKAALQSKKICTLATPKTLEEFADVISRPLFALDELTQADILRQWNLLATTIDDQSLSPAPWHCQDPDDQVFVDLAYSNKPCTLVSKDNQVLKLASRAAKEQVLITADYSLAL